jgi:hypothetical protein
MEKKRFFANHAKSSAMAVSLAIHAVLILVAISFVAVKVIVKEDQGFVEQRVKRPKMPPKKIQVPVNVKKRKPRPRLRKRIVSERKMADIKMPEISGVKGGLGNMGGDGLGSLGFDLDIGDLFGSNQSMGNELTGMFYDLKQTKDSKPIKMDNDRYWEALTKFAKGWQHNRLDDYFKAPKEKYATFFMIPKISADAAPKAYGVDDVVKPKHWVVIYKGQISAPETGHYRFCGIADDVLLVRVRGRLVIDACIANHIGDVTDWKSDDDNDRKFPMVNQHMAIGDWFKLTKGEPSEIEVLVGECPGGKFYCQLLIEQKGKSYQKVPYTYKKGGETKKGMRPILPIFKTKEITEKLVKEMKINPKVATLDGPSFGVVR